MEIMTAKGKKFEYDMLVENPTPPRLYIHIINSSLPEVAAVFTDQSELPIVGMPRYTEFQSISATPYGVNVALKVEGT